jgi:creatinine amidohydrolase/Fe(II)-dependent formamide hydrolase-like protein
MTTQWYYAELTAVQLADLDRERTLALMALSPLEVHGPHLPLGSDVLVALELQRRIVERLRRERPEFDVLLLPPLFAGADALPVPGSIDVDSRAIYRLLLDTGRSLAAQGFRSLLVTDNHGGPHHQIAVEKAVRRLWREHGFALLAPFNRFYERMVETDPGLLAATGTSADTSGGDSDAHAGTNETSILLVVAPGLVLPLWKTLPPRAVAEDVPVRRLVGAVAGLVRLCGGRRLARDLEHAGSLLSWINMNPVPPYIGAPAEATPEAGERMLQAHVDQAMAMLEETWAGQPPFSRPPLWSLRFLEKSR